MTLEDQIALRSLVRQGRLRLHRDISPERARSLISQGFAEPASLDPLPGIIEPTEIGALAIANAPGVDQ
jgi:hypothetical protein